MLNTAKEAAVEAGKILKQHFRKISISDIREKSKNDFLTYVDELAENKIIEIINKKFPEHSILAEESGGQKKNHSHCWIIDPLDGTKNYINGLPVFAVSIALQVNDQIIVSVVLDVMQNEMYYAEKGKGAFLIKSKIHVSESENIEKSLLATGFPFKNKKLLDLYMNCFKDIFKHCSGVRRMGAAAIDLAYVASGHYDAFWEMGLNPWDMAAGELLIREAGGKVTDFWNENNHLTNSFILASNTKVHEIVFKIISKHFPNKMNFTNLIK
jgi:myo-inositol-1(or 4)-monophosphatase